MKKVSYYIFFIFFAIFAIITLSTTPTWAGTTTLAWDPNTVNTEGNIAGYKVYYGTTSGNYTTVLYVGDVLQSTVDNLTDGQTYYFAITAYNMQGYESNYSNEVSLSVVGSSGFGCGRIKDISGGSGSEPAQIVLYLALLALLLSLGKIQVILRKNFNHL